MSKRNARRTAADEVKRSCPCGAGRTYGDCCGALHQGRATAPTAEALMRSRFSAFAVGDSGYLLRTWHSGTRPARMTLAAQQRWTRLDILGSERGGLFDTTGTVEFRAHYRQAGRPGAVHEQSRFAREGGQWVYVDGNIPESHVHTRAV